MVLGVCRGVLHHDQDAEDAFQATFLTLARKAGSVRSGESLAGFLYEVAYHAAVQAQATAARRRARERQAGKAAAASPPLDMTLRELQSVIHDELRELPEKYRLPLILHYLEGHSHEEAANLLGLSKGAFRGRLDRGREQLRSRLTCRGIAPAVALCAAELCLCPAPAAMAAVLKRVTQCAFSANAAGLVQGLPRVLFATRARVVTALLVAAGLCAGAAALTRQVTAARQPASAAPSHVPAAAKEVPHNEDGLKFQGRVLDPAGKPLTGAKIYLCFPTSRKVPMRVWGTSDGEGRFHFKVNRDELAGLAADESGDQVVPMAMAEGFGLGMAAFDTDAGFAGRELTLRLVPDTAPLDGRVLDLQGKPIAGVSVRVRGIRLPRDGELKTFLGALQSHKEGHDIQQAFLAGLHNDESGIDFDALVGPVISDVEGRFRLQGIGRERVVDLLIEGPTIESRYVYALTRPGPRIEVPDHKKHSWDGVMTHYGSTFDHIAAPSKPVVGRVTDSDTGIPLAGAVVKHYLLAGNSAGRKISFRAVTDKDGRFRITGMPHGSGNSLYASPPAGQPHLMMLKEAKETPGLEPMTVDFALKRGVWIDVRVTDKATGKSVPSRVGYDAFLDNPHLKNFPGLITPSSHAYRADGHFRVVGLPGRGLIAVWAQNNRYRVGVGVDKIKGLDRDVFHVHDGTVVARQTHGLAEVNPPEGAQSVSVDVVLDPGRVLQGTVLGPDGRPLVGAQVNGLEESAHWNTQWTAPLKSAQFMLSGLDTRPRLVQFIHKEKGLAGFLIVRGDEKGPVHVTLQAAATLTGRVVTRNGKPAVGGHIQSINTDWFSGNNIFPAPPDLGSFPRPSWTDKDGRFRVDGLAPGLNYELYYQSASFARRLGGKSTIALGDTSAPKLDLKPGQTKDLGDIVLDEAPE
jgi:RNA polymerase sigma factor (sigma-70 family)